MITEPEFLQLLNTFRVQCGFALDEEPVLRPGGEQAAFNRILRLLKKFPEAKSDVDRLMRLQTISTDCRRYLEALRADGGGFKPRFLAVVELNKRTTAEIRKLAPDAKARARDNWLKLLPKAVEKRVTTPTARRADAQAAWDNLQKVGHQGAAAAPDGKQLNEHYWKEIFDPRHRPPYFVDPNPGQAGPSYDALFAQWHKRVSPLLDDNRTPNPDFDPTYRDSFFQFLDTNPNYIPPDVGFLYLQGQVERDTYRVAAKAGFLIKKVSGRRFSTVGGEFNNPDRDDTYAHSPQRPSTRCTANRFRPASAGPSSKRLSRTASRSPPRNGT